MFTGLVADMGVVERVTPRQGGARVTLRSGAIAVDALALGESVACSGVCLTVVERGAGLVSFDAVPETLARTTLGSWRSGSPGNGSCWSAFPIPKPPRAGERRSRRGLPSTARPKPRWPSTGCCSARSRSPIRRSSAAASPGD